MLPVLILASPLVNQRPPELLGADFFQRVRHDLVRRIVDNRLRFLGVSVIFIADNGNIRAFQGKRDSAANSGICAGDHRFPAGQLAGRLVTDEIGLRRQLHAILLAGVGDSRRGNVGGHRAGWFICHRSFPQN